MGIAAADPSREAGVPSEAAGVHAAPGGGIAGVGKSEASLVGWLYRPVPVAPLVYFRLAFGVVLIWEVCRYVSFGWVDELFLAAKLHFTYFGFEWVRPWPGKWLHDHFYLLMALAGMIAAGALYRVASVLFFLGFTYVFLLEQANYLNHLYLVCLLAFLLVFLPAHRAASVDASGGSGTFATHVPGWTIALLRFQVGVPYFFGGVAKLNGDWLRGEPIREWMRGEHYLLVGGWPGTEGGVWVLSYGGLLFDLFIVPALLWRRTRPLAMVAAVAFHLFNAIAFSIGIFPWLMIATLPLFFSSCWWERVNERWVVRPAGRGRRDAPDTGAAGWTPRRRLVAGLLACYAAAQVLVPMRHLVYPGTVHWTEQGHRFAWHMMLRDKSGTARFVVSHPALPTAVEVDPAEWLTPRQLRKMPGHPDMVLQFARHLAAEYERSGYPGAEVRADVHVSLNGRPAQPLVDPGVDLAKVERSLAPAAWLVPLYEPLPVRRLPWKPAGRTGPATKPARRGEDAGPE